jgi:hypothetical protein
MTPNYTEKVNLSHIDSRIKSKFLGRSPNIPTELIEQNIFLIPFTIDHLGGLGYFAHRDTLFEKATENEFRVLIQKK